MRATKVVKDDVTSNIGNTAEAMGKDGAKTLKATYDFAIHTHGSIGPSCAIAEFKDGTLTSLVRLAGDPRSAQAARQMFGCRPTTCAASISKAPAAMGATATRMPPPTPRCSRKRSGKPVRVQWSRADEHGWDPKGPPTLIDMRAQHRRRTAT